MKLTITHIGTATLLLEIAPRAGSANGALRLLTDPVFDPPGGNYSFGWGTGSTKLTGPAVAPSSWGRSMRCCSATTTTTTTLTARGAPCCRRPGAS
jgi:hypothetical protein